MFFQVTPRISRREDRSVYTVDNRCVDAGQESYSRVELGRQHEPGVLVVQGLGQLRVGVVHHGGVHEGCQGVELLADSAGLKHAVGGESHLRAHFFLLPLHLSVYLVGTEGGRAGELDAVEAAVVADEGVVDGDGDGEAALLLQVGVEMAVKTIFTQRMERFRQR